MKQAVRLTGCALGLLCWGWALTAQASFLPPNNLHLQKSKKVGAITEEQFNAAIDELEQAYKDIVSSHNAQLVFLRYWNNPTVNAYAQKRTAQDGTIEWGVAMFGGLAQREEMTLDGFKLVICHELGHHLAGYPFIHDEMASEGEADYFATHSCAVKIWQDEPEENAKAAEKLTEEEKSGCINVWADEPRRNICFRTLVASKSLSHLLGALEGAEKPDLLKHDPHEVTETYLRHPQAQCRLDTYSAGALCTQAFDEHVIPGIIDGHGENSIAAQEDSAQYTCMRQNQFTWGVRPACWFKPLSGSEDPNEPVLVKAN